VKTYESQGKQKKMFRMIIIDGVAGEVKKLVCVYNVEAYEWAVVGCGISLTDTLYRNASFIR
jgi:hypothetical protein